MPLFQVHNWFALLVCALQCYYSVPACSAGQAAPVREATTPRSVAYRSMKEKECTRRVGCIAEPVLETDTSDRDSWSEPKWRSWEGTHHPLLDRLRGGGTPSEDVDQDEKPAVRKAAVEVGFDWHPCTNSD
eukprot:3156721-Rhodomonas_salina.2